MLEKDGSRLARTGGSYRAELRRLFLSARTATPAPRAAGRRSEDGLQGPDRHRSGQRSHADLPRVHRLLRQDLRTTRLEQRGDPEPVDWTRREHPDADQHAEVLQRAGWQWEDLDALP